MMPTYWGVDSARTVNTVADDDETIAFYAVSNRAGMHPKFWGRYIGGNYQVGADEIQYLHDKNCKVFLTYNHGTTAADVQGSVQDGQDDAADAIAAAAALGAPANIVIFVDVEGTWAPSSDWIQGWVSGIAADPHGYIPGFYCDATPGALFDLAYGPACANEPAVAQALIWSLRPQRPPQCQAGAGAPPFGPKNVSNGNNSVMWQYTIDCWEDLLGADAGIDMDLATDAAFNVMWAPPGP